MIKTTQYGIIRLYFPSPACFTIRKLEENQQKPNIYLDSSDRNVDFSSCDTFFFLLFFFYKCVNLIYNNALLKERLFGNYVSFFVSLRACGGVCCRVPFLGFHHLSVSVCRLCTWRLSNVNQESTRFTENHVNNSKYMWNVMWTSCLPLFIRFI